MTKTKWHFSQKTMTETKTKFAVKMKTAVHLNLSFCTEISLKWQQN